MEQRLIDRRSFLKYCGGIAATLGLSTTMVPQIVKALTSDSRPPVVWLHFSGCSGCGEAFLRTTDPGVADILFDVLNVTYHETLQAACGEKAEHNLDQTVADHAGEFICVVEGAIPMAQGGVFGMIGGRTMLDMAQSVIPKAKHTICLGTCASFGGLPAAAPNPTGAMGISDALGMETINITGCPPHPMNLVACITNYLLFDRMPPLRADNRPYFCHGKLVHQQCITPHGCMLGYNCKGPQTYNNCPRQLYNAESYCIKVEHQCIGCAEPGFWDKNAPFYNPMWTAMRSTFRQDAEPHMSQDNASCTPCHGPRYFERMENFINDEHRFQRRIHRRHQIDLQTNQGCAGCHPQAPGGTNMPIDD